MKTLSRTIAGLLLLCSAMAIAEIGGNEAAVKNQQQNLAWQQAIADFAQADADEVIKPYLSILTRLKTQPPSNWCRPTSRSLIKKALSLNKSSLTAHAMLYRCALKSSDRPAKKSHTETITGLIGLLVGQKNADSIENAIAVRELMEAPLILQAMGYSVLDSGLNLDNGGLYYRYHVIEPLSGKVTIRYFTNLHFLKQQMNKASLSDDAAIQLILRAYRQQSLDLIIKYQARSLIAQEQYQDAEKLLEHITDYSMIKNVLLGQIYLHTKRYGQWQRLHQDLMIDAKSGFTAAGILIAQFYVSHYISNKELIIDELISQVSHFTRPGEGAYRLALALLADEKSARLSLPWLERAIEQQHAKAAFKLAKLYQQGQVVSADLAKGFHLLEQAKDFGHDDAAIEIARYYHQGDTMIKADHALELSILHQLVAQQNADAMYLLGERYEYGVDVPQDMQQALDYYLAAWQSGLADAANQIAILYEFGKLPSQAGQADFAQAYSWYEKASQQGNFNGLFNLGRYHQFGIGREVDLKKAAMFYLSAANNGSVIAYCHLASTLLKMDHHKGQDRQTIRAKAKSLYELGAKSDNKICPRQLGHFYQNELADTKSALHWYAIAAKGGDLNAIAYQAHILGFGPGELVDLDRSVTLHRIAAQAGHAMAQANLGLMYQQGRGVDVDYHQANSWYYQAAAQGDGLAKWSLGKNLLTGKGIEKDDAKGWQLIREAAAAGYQPAIDFLQQKQD